MKKGDGRFSPDQELPSFDIKRHASVFYLSNVEIMAILFKRFCFGRICNDRLVLSPYEVFFINFLEGKGNLRQLWNECSRICGEQVWVTRYAVYHFYKCNFWVVKDGATFGGDFVLYKDHPDIVHSKYIVIVLDNWDKKENEIVIASRVGWSVKKVAVFVHVVIPDGTDLSDPNCIRYFAIEDLAINRLKFR